MMDDVVNILSYSLTVLFNYLIKEFRLLSLSGPLSLLKGPRLPRGQARQQRSGRRSRSGPLGDLYV